MPILKKNRGKSQNDLKTKTALCHKRDYVFCFGEKGIITVPAFAVNFNKTKQLHYQLITGDLISSSELEGKPDRICLKSE